MLLLTLWLLLAGAGAARGSCVVQPSTVRVNDYTPINTIVGQLAAAPGSSNIDVGSTNSFNSGASFQLLANLSLQLTTASFTTGILTVYCVDSLTALLVLARVETDDNPPVWRQSVYRASISEAQATPYQLPVRPTADDADGPDSKQKLVYAILPGSYSDHFSLNNPEQLVMNISLVKRLDYEVVQRISLGLRVQDFNSSGVKVFEANATLEVAVENVDDVNPVWRGCSGDPCYVRQLLSNASAGVRVLPPVGAADGDFGTNVSIVYSIISQSPEAIVAIDNATGDLTLVRSLPRPQTYSVVLFATQADDATKKTEAKLQLNVLSTSYAPPVFDKAVSSVTLRENGVAEQLVTVVRATAHLDAPVTYSLVNFNDVFSIGASSGTIKTRASLDYEARAAYAINVSASDGAGSSFAVVSLAVENVNEFNPSFERSDYEFPAARRELGLAVGTVRAVDNDTQPVTYSIPDVEFDKLFAVGASDGVVSLAAEGAALPLQTYRFSVAASDGSRTAAVGVSVSFDSALQLSSNASVSVIALSALGGIIALIIIASIAAFLLYRCRSSKDVGKDGSQFSRRDSFGYADLYGNELKATSQQDNPIEGYNNYMFGEEDAPDVSPFNRERDQSEIFVSDTLYHNGTVDYSTLTNGSIHTFSGSSLGGSQRTLVSGRPQPLHNGSNLQVVQVENAIDANGEAANAPGLTVYF